MREVYRREGFADKAESRGFGERTGGEDRIESVSAKALRLFRAGRVRRVAGDKWTVLGDHGRYEVDGERQTCSCPSRVYCSHRYAVSVAVAKRNASTRREVEKKRAARSERFFFTSAEVERNIAGLERMA